MHGAESIKKYISCLCWKFKDAACVVEPPDTVIFPTALTWIPCSSYHKWHQIKRNVRSYKLELKTVKEIQRRKWFNAGFRYRFYTAGFMLIFLVLRTQDILTGSKIRKHSWGRAYKLLFISAFFLWTWRSKPPLRRCSL
jgi:hypothetical protein